MNDKFEINFTIMRELSREQIIELNKQKNTSKKSAVISECFYHNKQECKGSIKKAHSLQKNGKLSLIEGDINGQKMIYCLNEHIPNSERYVGDLKAVGKNSASTFNGFCDHHDTTLFLPIEVKPYNHSDEHNFLHSYRSFAYSQHSQMQDVKYLSEMTEKSTRESKFLRGREVGVSDGEMTRKKLSSIIENKQYDELEYLVYTVGRAHPVLCAGVVNPPYYYDGRVFNKHDDYNVPYSDIIITVFPEGDCTVIILTCMPDDIYGIKFLDQLNKLPDLKFEKAISSLMISNVPNTYFAPALWNTMGEEKKDFLLAEVDFWVRESTMADVDYVGFFHSKINFFDQKYTFTRLGITV